MKEELEGIEGRIVGYRDMRKDGINVMYIFFTFPCIGKEDIG